MSARLAFRFTPETSRRAPLPSSSSFIAAAIRRAEGPVRATMASARSGSAAGVERATLATKASSPAVHISSRIRISAKLFMAALAPAASR